MSRGCARFRRATRRGSVRRTYRDQRGTSRIVRLHPHVPRVVGLNRWPTLKTANPASRSTIGVRLTGELEQFVRRHVLDFPAIVTGIGYFSWVFSHIARPARKRMRRTDGSRPSAAHRAVRSLKPDIVCRACRVCWCQRQRLFVRASPVFFFSFTKPREEENCAAWHRVRRDELTECWQRIV